MQLKNIKYVACLVVMLSLAASLTGCKTPEQRHAISSHTFTAIVASLADMREQGMISDDSWVEIVEYIELGDTMLDAHRQAMLVGDTEVSDSFWPRMDRLLQKLRQYQREAALGDLNDE